MMLMLRTLWLLLMLSSSLLASLAQAHEMSMAEMELRETSKGTFLWQWSAANDKRASTDDLRPHWPEGCVADTATVQCGSQGMRGTLEIEGVGSRYSAALIKVFWLDGDASVYTLTASQPKVQLYGSSKDTRGMREIASAYVVLGVEHILSGYDHLLFVLGLLFLVGFERRLLWTITAFTVAHSLTLASAALGLLTLRPAPVEATIALSIMLVASEALNPRQTLARRWPAALAFLFGLIHGLGFAGALKEVGLPQSYLSTALLTFNVGVELGQLLVLAAAWLIWRATRQWSFTSRWRVPLLYVMGAVAAYWSWLRVVAIFG